jgi:hypothetical protein
VLGTTRDYYLSVFAGVPLSAGTPER